MTIITRNIKWIMLISGLITCSMIYAAIAPQAALMQTFGAELNGDLANIVVRNWGALITLVGLMLIYGAFRPELRAFILQIASVSKIIFIALVLTYGSQYLDKAAIAVVFDTIVVLLYVIYLINPE